MDLSVGDEFWSIAEVDESAEHDLGKRKKRAPHKVRVVELDPVRVGTLAEFGQEEPADHDSNASTHFFTVDPEEYLFSTKLPAWLAFKDYIENRVEYYRGKADRLENMASAISEAVESGDDPYDAYVRS